MIAELASQFMPHPATQVDIRNRGNVEENNNEFQWISSQVRRKQAAPAGPRRPRLDSST